MIQWIAGMLAVIIPFGLVLCWFLESQKQFDETKKRIQNVRRLGNKTEEPQ